MPLLKPTLQVVQQYLHVLGYRTEYITVTDGKVTQDGHWLIGWCIHYSKGNLCPCNIPVALEHLFQRLEGGNKTLGQPPLVAFAKWTRKDTNAALAAGGYEPYDK